MNNRDTKLIDASEQTVRAAWLYYVAGNTQEQTADLLGTSRVKVNRLLAEARDLALSRYRLSIALLEWPGSKRQFEIVTNFCSAARRLL